MRSFEHAAIGAVAGWLSVTVLAPDRPRFAKLALWLYGLVLSVFIDLDHFLIARLKTGSWSYLTNAVRHPVWAFTRQREVFPDLNIRLERLASHVAIGGVLVVAFRPFSRPLARVTAVVVSVHLLADLLRDLELA